MEREALKLALEALGKAKRQIVHAKVAPHGCIGDAITAIKEALAQPSDSVEKPIDFELAYGEIYKDQRAALAKSLAQPAQEPASVTYNEVADTMNALRKGNFSQKAAAEEVGKLKLYTTPPQRTWVGLTAEEAAECWTTSATQTWKNFEAKLKEKNT